MIGCIPMTLANGTCYKDRICSYNAAVNDSCYKDRKYLYNVIYYIYIFTVKMIAAVNDRA